MRTYDYLRKRIKYALTMTILVLIFFAVPVLAVIPMLINFQGRLTDQYQATLEGTVNISNFGFGIQPKHGDTTIRGTNLNKFDKNISLA